MKAVIKVFIILALFLSGAAELYAEDFVIPLNRSRLISTGPEIGEAMIANPEIADIHVHGPNRLSVIGVGRGETTLRIIAKDGTVIKSIPISVTYDLPAIRRALRNFLPQENIGVELVNTNVALVGEVSSAAAVDRALDIVTQFLEEDSAPAGNGGTPRDTIVNLLKVVSGQQVMLRVRVAEINRTALKQLGVSLQGFSNNGSVRLQGGSNAGTLPFVNGSTANFGTFDIDSNNMFGFLGGIISKGDFGLGATLDMLETDGLLKVLAEPNLVALSGEQAEFLAGGEIPIPIAQPSSGNTTRITIDYKPFGVSVSFIPYVLSNNRIRLSVLPEVSELSSENGIKVNGFAVPAITTRRAKTTVELAPGESFMIAGLIRDNMSSVIRQLPGVSEIPIIGALLRSSEFRRNETELVIAVTPYLVDPLKSDDIRLPSDNFRPPSTMEMFFYGALSSIANGERRLSQTPSLEGPIGFMVE